MKSLKMLAALFLAIVSVMSVSASETAACWKYALMDNLDFISVAATSPVLALNAYSGQYEKKLFSTMVNSMQVRNDVTIIRDVKSKIQMTKLAVSDGARPYLATEQIRATLNYTPRVLEVDLFKREEEIEIKKYHKTWLEEMMSRAEGSSSTAETIPFAEYTWDQVIRHMAAELNDKTAYYGFDKSLAVAYDAGDAYAVGDYITFTAADGISDYWECVTITTAGQSPITHAAKWKIRNAEAITPGFKYRLQQLITSGDVVPKVIGAINNSSVYAYASFSSLYRQLPQAYRDMGVTAYCSYTDYDFLRDDCEDKVAKYTEKDFVAGGGMFLPKSDRKCFVKPCSWMAGSRRIILTPKENMIMGVDRPEDGSVISRVKEELWTVKYGISGSIGFQIRDPKALICNDQA